MDDGEASWGGGDNHRPIDYMRETPQAIEQAWHDAGVKNFEAQMHQLKVTQDGHYNVNGVDIGFRTKGEALEATQPPKPEQEPVAWRVKVETKLRNGLVDVGYQVRSEKLSRHDEPLYTHPPQRTWVGLTDVEIAQAIKSINMLHGDYATEIAYAIESKLKELNT